jgi:cytochrome P450
LARDPLGFLQRCRQDFGDVVFLRVRGLDIFLLSNPRHIEEVLVRQPQNFTVDRLSRGLADALGNSVLVSEGSVWEQHRRLLQPVLNRMQVQRYATVTVELTRQQVAGFASGQRVDIFDQMMQLTLKIVARSLLNYDVSGEVQVFQKHLDHLMNHVLGIARSGLRLPLRIPTPSNRAARAALRYFDAIIYSVIEQRRGADSDTGDLVTAFLGARDDDGRGLTDHEIRNELLTMLLVGHDTSALGLTFACWLLARHPEVGVRLAEEVDAVVGDRPLSFQDVGRLPYTEAVWRESLRLYPPVWALGREAIRACEVGGFPARRGAQVLLSPWVSHHNPRLFDDPEAFRPERWITSQSDAVPPYAYFPFGGGPRMCIGYGFARMESILILAALAQRFSLEADDATLRLLPSVTLRPRGPVMLTVVARPSSPA